MHLSAIKLKLLTGEFNNIDHLFTLTHVNASDVFGSKWTISYDMLQLSKQKDLSNFDKAQIIVANGLGWRISTMAGCSWCVMVSTYKKWSKGGHHGCLRFIVHCAQLYVSAKPDTKLLN